MATRTELLEIIYNGENSGVEFKRDDVENFKLARELVALSNLSGGMVLLGVEDDGQIAGISRANLEEWVMTACRDKIRPAITPFFELLRDFEPGKDIALVRVTRGYDVHALWHNNSSKIYIRVGSQSREASLEEMRRLFQQRGALRAELQPVSGASIESLDRRRLRDYFGRVRQQENPSDEDESAWETLLYNTEFIGDEGVTLGSVLLFGTTPNRHLPHAGISAAAYPGVEKDYATLERNTIRGPMVPLFGANGAIVENGLVEQALEFVQRNTRTEAQLENGRRVDRPAYPQEVLREAIVNALIHRDYLLTSTDIELSVFRDRIEIISPGRLPNGITPDRMRTGCRASRNQLIRDTMYDYGYLEGMGMGIPRKIVRGMKAHNGTEPTMIENYESFVLTLQA